MMIPPFKYGCSSLCPESDSALCQIIYRNLDRDLIAREDTDIIHAHFTGNVSGNDVTVCQFDTEYRVRQYFNDHAFTFNNIVLSQNNSSFITVRNRRVLSTMPARSGWSAMRRQT